jgi:hypothetical protein
MHLFLFLPEQATVVEYSLDSLWKYCKGFYNHGNERPDVVRSRQSFLDRMLVYERRMTAYEREFMDTEVPPMLSQGERLLMLVTMTSPALGRKEDKREIRPKGNGRNMVSAFLCECHGLLR